MLGIRLRPRGHRLFRTARLGMFGWNVFVFGLLLFILGAAAYGIFKSRIYEGVDAELSHQQDNVLSYLPENGYSADYAYHEMAIPAEYRSVLATSSGQIDQATGCTANPFALFPPPPYCIHLTALSQDAIDAVVAATRGKTAFSPDRPLVATNDDLRTVTYEGQPWRVLTFAISWQGRVIGIFQVGRVASGEASALAELRILLIFGGLLGLLLAAFAGLFLADRALVPIRQAFARQRQFTADASHELRTPLALIRANAEMLYRHTSTSGQDGELIGEIIRETDHLNRLVGDLLTLARADAESLKLVARPVDFRSLVSSVNEDLQAIAESRGIRTDVTLDGPVVVQGDEGRLRQLLLILLDNALKYTDPGGWVEVSIRREDNRAKLVVADSGIGIPAKDLPHIFDRFYRVDRAREHESGGTGLGLAIAEWIVVAHHGNIKVESDQGRGARFQVELPAGG